MKIFSKLAKCHFSWSSCSSISSSFFRRETVWSVLYFRISETERNIGLSPTITHAFGEMETSQSVKAYRASIIISGETSLASKMLISTSSEVLSSIFLILILPFSLAFKILSIRSPVFLEKGNSVMHRVFLSFWIILALARIFPPRFPSL